MVAAQPSPDRVAPATSRRARGATAAVAGRIPVLIAGGGPVGLTVAALLARHGVRSLVIEADDRSARQPRHLHLAALQEILWTAGRARRSPPRRCPGPAGAATGATTRCCTSGCPASPRSASRPWSTSSSTTSSLRARGAAARAEARAGGLVHARDRRAARRRGVEVEVEDAPGPRAHPRGYVVACDGGRSTVREAARPAARGHPVRRPLRDRRHRAEDATGRWSAWPGSTRRPTRAPRC